MRENTKIKDEFDVENASKVLNQKISEYCFFNEVSKKKVSDEMGVSLPRLSVLLSNPNTCDSIRNLKAICKAFNVKLSEVRPDLKELFDQEEK